MNVSKDSRNDLTTTINLAQLRAVPAPTQLDSALERLSPEDRKIIAGLSPDKAMLIGASGPAKGFRFLLDNNETTIGREIGVDISLDDVTVSRKHAHITSQSGTYILEDSKSLNGTYVNSISISSAPLKDGDEIQLGKFRFIFFSGKVNP